MNTGSIGVSADPYTDSQSLPPAQLGHASRSWLRAEKSTSRFSVTSPVITFSATVGLAHRPSPVSRSRGVDDPGLAGDARPSLAATRPAAGGVDSGDGVRSRGDRGVDEQALEEMVEIPVVVQVLTVPADLAGSVARASVELWYGCVFSMLPGRNFGAGEVTDVATDVATRTRFRSRSTLGAVHDPGERGPRRARRPRLSSAGSPGGGHEPPSPELLTGLGVVDLDDARLGSRPGRQLRPEKALTGGSLGSQRRADGARAG